MARPLREPDAPEIRPQVVFYFDVSCPYSYIASTRIDDVIRFTQANCVWRPVSQAGLYELDGNKLGRDGYPEGENIPEAKRVILARQFQNDLKRYRVPLKFHPNHPLSSTDAGRLLCAFPALHRPRLARALYKAYFVDSSNIASRPTLIRIARGLKIPTQKLGFELDEAVFADQGWADKLKQNTEEAHSRGAFDVPWFYIPDRDKSYFGQDRLHLVEAELYAIKRNTTFPNLQNLERLWPRCLRTPAENRYRQLRFWFDFSSPWSYLAYTQLERIQREAGPALEIVYKPFHLQSLFKAIGLPDAPVLAAQTPLRQKYESQDLADWTEWFNAVNEQEYPPLDPPNTRFPDNFPIKSETALKVALADPKTIGPIFRATWRDNKNISDPEVLSSILSASSFDGPKLLSFVSPSSSKSEALVTGLKNNTAEAVKIGICGSTTLQLQGEHRDRLIWGADRLNIVSDMLCGWHPEYSRLRATVAAFPSFDYRL